MFWIIIDNIKPASLNVTKPTVNHSRKRVWGRNHHFLFRQKTFSIFSFSWLSCHCHKAETQQKIVCFKKVLYKGFLYLNCSKFHFIPNGSTDSNYKDQTLLWRPKSRYVIYHIWHILHYDTMSILGILKNIIVKRSWFVVDSRHWNVELFVINILLNQYVHCLPLIT